MDQAVSYALRFTLPAVLALAAALAAPAEVSPFDLKVEQTLQAEWANRKVSENVHRDWSERATPAFPSVWPLADGATLVVYGYLYRRPESGRDLEKQAGPFCKLVAYPGKRNAIKAVALEFDLRKAESQGVWPLGVKELAVLKGGDRVRELLLRMARGQSVSTADLQVVKSCFKLWRHCNSVISPRIAAEHKEFFAWLDES